MTPAITLLKKTKTTYQLHQYVHEPDSRNYGDEAVAKLGVESAKVFKTLMLESDQGYLAVAVIPVSQQLQLKHCAKALGWKRARLAKPETVERTSGYLLGGVSPLGQKKRLHTLLDSSALAHKTLFVSGGLRGLEIEMAATDLIRLSGAEVADLGV